MSKLIRNMIPAQSKDDATWKRVQKMRAFTNDFSLPSQVSTIFSSSSSSQDIISQENLDTPDLLLESRK
jgi:hypothetical protein